MTNLAGLPLGPLADEQRMQELIAFYGEPISIVTRKNLIDDGVLVDVTQWASAETGFMGGFTCPVAMTRRLWEALQPPRGSVESVRGRAHDVLVLARAAFGRERQSDDVQFTVKIGRRNHVLRAQVDGDGVLIGYPDED